MIRTSFTILALAALSAGCAMAGPEGSGTAPTRPTSVIVSTGGITAQGTTGADVILEADNTVTARVLAAPVDRVWAVADQVYLEMGIPVTLRNEEQKILGNNRFAPGRQLNGTRLSNYLNCGTDHLGGNVADSYTVTMEVRSQVVPAPGGQSELRSTLSGSARPRSGAGGGAVRCTSRGVLEQRIATAFQLKLATTGS